LGHYKICLTEDCGAQAYKSGRCRDCSNAMGRALYIKNRDKRIASAKKCAAKHADRVAAYDREYRAKNKDILQEKANVRRNKRIKTIHSLNYEYMCQQQSLQD